MSEIYVDGKMHIVNNEVAFYIGSLEGELQSHQPVSINVDLPEEVERRYVTIILDGEDWVENKWCQVLNDELNTEWGWEDDCEGDITHWMAIPLPDEKGGQ